MTEQVILKNGERVELGFGYRDGYPYFVRADSSSYEFESQIFPNDLQNTLDCFSRTGDFEVETIKWELKIGRREGQFYYYRGDYTIDGFKWAYGNLSEMDVTRFVDVLKTMIAKSSC